MTMTRTCDACGVPFITTRSTARWCSARCRKRVQRGSINATTEPGRVALSIEVSADIAAELTERAHDRRQTVAGLLEDLAKAAAAGQFLELVDMRTDGHRGWAVISP